MSQWAYEMSNEELVKDLMRTCARAGTAGSGLVIDVTGPYVAAEAQYLKGVILSRLAGQNRHLNATRLLRWQLIGFVHIPAEI